MGAVRRRALAHPSWPRASHRAGAAPPALGERQALSLLTPAPTSVGFYFLARERGVRAKACSCSGSSRLPPSSCVRAIRAPARARRTGWSPTRAAVLARALGTAGASIVEQARRLAEASRATPGARPGLGGRPTDQLRRRARAPAVGAGREALPRVRRRRERGSRSRRTGAGRPTPSPSQGSGRGRLVVRERSGTPASRPARGPLGRVSGKCVSKESLRAHRVALDRRRQRHQELDEVAVGERMRRSMPTRAPRNSCSSMRAVVTGDDLTELPAPPLAERRTPALAVDRPDPLVQRRIEVSLGVLEIGQGVAVGGGAGCGEQPAGPRPSRRRAQRCVRRTPRRASRSRHSFAGCEQLTPLATAVPEQAVAVVAVERDGAGRVLPDARARCSPCRTAESDRGSRIPRDPPRGARAGVPGHDLEFCVRRFGDCSCVRFLRQHRRSPGRRRGRARAAGRAERPPR